MRGDPRRTHPIEHSTEIPMPTKNYTDRVFTIHGPPLSSRPLFHKINFWVMFMVVLSTFMENEFRFNQRFSTMSNKRIFNIRCYGLLRTPTKRHRTGGWAGGRTWGLTYVSLEIHMLRVTTSYLILSDLIRVSKYFSLGHNFLDESIVQ